ncbi:type IV pilus modification PilV family protein [Candidatus Electronema sp. JM]|uniref:type IV pilus modification PilV family protein n=1 Tax=Candidatus Electronema sp. JM TaxID=3401571 RepID=UPI003AA94BE2
MKTERIDRLLSRGEKFFAPAQSLAAQVAVCAKGLLRTGQTGFTLIEVLIAMAIFTIGILGLFGMQSAVITKNLSANTITSGATWATDQIELLLGQDYINLEDKNKDGCAGINNSPLQTDTNKQKPDSYPSLTSGTTPPVYTIHWNVARNCFMTAIPDAINEREEQKPKLIRVIVTVNRGLGEQEIATFNYIKQNVKQQN